MRPKFGSRICPSAAATNLASQAYIQAQGDSTSIGKRYVTWAALARSAARSRFASSVLDLKFADAQGRAG
ncbi:MAG: hypothetical protein JWO83_1616 [Caulobacteraceae bacterium]|jgi:hypothetical protein|nr:hypothetical protein [Caulobacteraceae bacterium]